MSNNKLMLEYLAFLTHERGLSPLTVEAYNRDLNKLLSFMVGTDLDVLTMTRQDLSQFMITLASVDRLHANSRRRVIAGVRGFFRFLENEGHRSNNPAADLVRPEAEQSLPFYLTQDECVRLLTSTEGLRDRTVLSVLVYAGLRASELCTLRVKDIDHRGILTVTGKGSKTRRVPTTLDCVCLLLDWITYAGREANDTVFRLTRQEVWAIVKAAGKRIDRDVYPHLLRHSFATHMIKTAGVRFVQQMLGHQVIDTTVIYTHINNEDLKKSYLKHHPRA